MKTVLDLNSVDARTFFLKKENYCSLKLPEYICFDSLLQNISKVLTGKKFSESTTELKPKHLESVNYTLLNNKDGKFAWRPFQLIHPVLYFFLVQEITTEENWNLIKSKFENFYANDKIECHSLPITELNESGEKQNQIYQWWDKVELRSLALSLEFSHLLHLDIANCYGSIYTHTIDWALHTIEVAKERRNLKSDAITKTKDIGQVIDEFIQYMSYGQTNGIPQGSKLMDFIAEIVLGLGDLMLTEELAILKITDYKIIRYRDDYRIFTNNPHLTSEIVKVLSGVLSKLNFKINSAKTYSTNDIVLGSLKPDKVHWIYNKRKTNNIQQWLIQLYVLGKEYPNSGSLLKETKFFLDCLQNKKNSEEGLNVQNPEVMIILLVNLAFNNPKLYELVTASLSLLMPIIKNEEDRRSLLIKIKNKFSELPNTDYLNVLLQRITIKVDSSINYTGILCNKVKDPSIQIWNSDWLNPKIKKIVEESQIINQDVIDKMEIPFSDEELDRLNESIYF
jgi:RNA-directed DNA polymerase